MKIKSSQNEDITLPFTDIGISKLLQSQISTLQTGLLTLFCGKKNLPFFFNLQHTVISFSIEKDHNEIHGNVMNEYTFPTEGSIFWTARGGVI